MLDALAPAGTTPALAPAVAVPSALNSSNAADDSWFAPHEGRPPVRHAPVCGGNAYRAYCAEYAAKLEVYHRLHQEMSSVRRCKQARSSYVAVNRDVSAQRVPHICQFLCHNGRRRSAWRLLRACSLPVWSSPSNSSHLPSHQLVSVLWSALENSAFILRLRAVAACMSCRYVQALKEAALAAPNEAQREEYGAQAARLFGRTRALMQRWSGAFQVRPGLSDVAMPGLAYRIRMRCMCDACIAVHCTAPSKNAPAQLAGHLCPSCHGSRSAPHQLQFSV